MTTGRNASTGPVPDRPSSEAPQPLVNRAVMAPSAATTDSRLSAEATSGMSRLRNTAVSRMNARMTTTATNRGSLLPRTCAKSIAVAVWPPTWTTRPLPCSAWGIRLSRRVLTRVTVRWSCGAVAG